MVRHRGGCGALWRIEVLQGVPCYCGATGSGRGRSSGTRSGGRTGFIRLIRGERSHCGLNVSMVRTGNQVVTHLSGFGPVHQAR